jgi:hypothetical protein
MLEKMIEVKTFITSEGYRDVVENKGFDEINGLLRDYTKLLKDFNRAVLKSSEIQEVKTVMSYHKEKE